MSITKDFEGKRARLSILAMPYEVYGAEDVIKLLAHTRSLEAMLRKHEWSSSGYHSSTDHCPECGYMKGTGHIDCQLAKLLEGVE